MKLNIVKIFSISRNWWGPFFRDLVRLGLVTIKWQKLGSWVNNKCKTRESPDQGCQMVHFQTKNYNL
jgi:hypothetical protein